VRRTRLIVCLLLAACDRGPDAIATVREVSGDVTVKPEADAAPAPAAVGRGLLEGDIITTGKDGKSRLEFAGGNVIDIAPDTSLVIRRAGAAVADIGAVLLNGSARARSGGAGVSLSIGAPFGITSVGSGEQELTLSTLGGVTVLVGAVTVMLENGEQKTIQAGNMLQLDGLIVPVGGGADADAGLRLDPITVVLLANPKQVQLQRDGAEQWTAPKKRDTLGNGDAVRTRKADGTLVQFGDMAGLTLDAGTEMTLDSAALDPKSHRARYTITNGTANVMVNRKDGTTAEHEVVAGGTPIKIRPGLERADVDVTTGKDGRVKVAVQLGQAELPDGTIVDAGSSVNLDKGKTEGEVRPLASTEVELKPKNNSILYFLRDVPPVFFSWKLGEDPKKEFRIEVAKDKDFTDVVFREKLTKAGFVYDGFQSGRYYWRVSSGESSEKGTFVIKKGGDNECKNCTRTNIIYDTGEKTVVYYQQALPSITLRWDQVNGATQYRVKVFPDGDFDNPVVDQAVTETTVMFKPGKLAEGKYYWFVSGEDAAGKSLATGRTNSLEIAYDNAVTDLAIKSPSDGSRVSGKTLVTTGEAQLGAKLYINGAGVRVDGSGRFRHTVSLTPGENRLVYRTIATDGIERFYVRSVDRK
jgi:hypothetical protein